MAGHRITATAATVGHAIVSASAASVKAAEVTAVDVDNQLTLNPIH